MSVDKDTKARYKMLGQDLYIDLDIISMNAKVDSQHSVGQYSEANADLILSMLKNGYDPLQLTIEEKTSFVQYFGLRLLDDFIKDDVIQDRKDNPQVPLDSTAEETSLTKPS